MKTNWLDGQPLGAFVTIGLVAASGEGQLRLTEQKLLISGVKEDELADAAADEVRTAISEAIQLVRRRAES